MPDTVAGIVHDILSRLAQYRDQLGYAELLQRLRWEMGRLLSEEMDRQVPQAKASEEAKPCEST